MLLTKKINELLSVVGLQVVRTAILYDWQTGAGERKQDLLLPAEGVDYLALDNPRLLELRRRYGQFQVKASVPIVWTEEYMNSYDLQSFRGDNCYVWQTKDPNCDEINYCLTAYYVKAIDVLGLLQINNEDGLFGVHTYTVDGQVVSRDLLDSVIELNFLEKHLHLSTITDLKILDIGAGYGRLAYRTARSFPNLRTYLCTDAVPESTFLSEYHCNFRQIADKVAIVPLDNITERLQGQQIDLAVNIHSFSECGLEAIDWWLALLATNRIKNLLIIPNAADHKGEKLALNSGEDFSYLVEKYGYKLHCKAPKYADPLVQKFGISPTFFYLYQLTD